MRQNYNGEQCKNFMLQPFWFFPTIILTMSFLKSMFSSFFFFFISFKEHVELAQRVIEGWDILLIS